MSIELAVLIVLFVGLATAAGWEIGKFLYRQYQKWEAGRVPVAEETPYFTTTESHCGTPVPTVRDLPYRAGGCAYIHPLMLDGAPVEESVEVSVMISRRSTKDDWSGPNAPRRPPPMIVVTAGLEDGSEVTTTTFLASHKISSEGAWACYRVAIGLILTSVIRKSASVLSETTARIATLTADGPPVKISVRTSEQAPEDVVAFKVRLSEEGHLLFSGDAVYGAPVEYRMLSKIKLGPNGKQENKKEGQVLVEERF